MLRKNDIVAIEGIVSFDVGQDETVYVQLPGQLHSCVLRPEQVRLVRPVFQVGEAVILASFAAQPQVEILGQSGAHVWVTDPDGGMPLTVSVADLLRLETRQSDGAEP